MATCYRHPGRETGVACSNCGRPICPDCMTPTAVGMRCPECAGQRTKVRTIRSNTRRGYEATLALIALNVIVFFVEGSTALTFSGDADPNSSVMFHGLLYGPFIKLNHEDWRLLTSGFLHWDIIHIAFNMYALYWLGRLLDRALALPLDLLHRPARRLTGRAARLPDESDRRRLRRDLRAAGGRLRRGARARGRAGAKSDRARDGDQPRAHDRDLRDLDRRPHRRSDRRWAGDRRLPAGRSKTDGRARLRRLRGACGDRGGGVDPRRQRDQHGARLGPARRPRNQRPADLPLVSEGVGDRSKPPSVFIGVRAHLAGTGCERPRDHGVGVLDHEQQSHGGAAERLRAEGAVLGRLIVDPERGLADLQLRNDRLVLVGAADAVDLDGSESRLVELDRRAAAAHGQFGDDRGHRRAHSSSATPGALGTWRGWRMCASSSSPSISRGPGREK